MQIQEEKGTFYRPKWELKAKGQPHPARRWCHTTTIHGSHLYIMGGRLAQSAKTREFVYRVNCQTFLCEPVQLSDNPMMRESHSCVLVNDSMYVMFGINKASKVLNDCLQLKITPNCLVWQKKSQNPQIDPRESHMSLLLEGKYILIYGGINSEENSVSDFYLFDIERQSWRKIAKVQGAIQGKVGGTLIIIKNQIYLFGGQINDQNQYSNQIYKIQIRNFREPEDQPQIEIFKLNVTGPKPLPRSQFASVAFKDRYLIILGGECANKQNTQCAKLLGDVWSFDTEKMMWEEIIPENPNIFKPRSSFTANVYKDSLIVFGGLVAFKDFRSSDEMFVLNLNTEIEKKPMCNLCKSSYKVIPKQQIQVQKSKARMSTYNFSTGFSTISAISRTIEDPFVALGTLLHSFDDFQVEKCSIVLYQQKLMLNLKNINITDFEWKHILESYEFVPLIQQRDDRVKKALRNEIRQNIVNYLSYNIKNSGFRLGNELLITWINNEKQLQICLINKFGIYHTMNINTQVTYTPSQTSIILQYLREYNINILDLYQNSMTICVTSLKTLQFLNGQKQIQFNRQQNDIFCADRKFYDYLKVAFAKKLSFDVAVSGKNVNFSQIKQFFAIGTNDKNKWSQENKYPDLFQKIFTYEKIGKSEILVYQNNKLMHKKQVSKGHDKVFEFHLTKNIESNLTFSDVLPTLRLMNAIKSVTIELSLPATKNLKREKSFEREQNIESLSNSLQKMECWDNVTKAVKTNENENCEIEMELEMNQKERKSQ